MSEREALAEEPALAIINAEDAGRLLHTGTFTLTSSSEREG